MDPLELEPTHQSLLGIWTLHPENKEAIQTFGETTLYFYPDGQLIYEAIGFGKSFLTWRIEGNLLITDQPSHPWEMQEEFYILPDKKLPQLIWKSPDKAHPEHFVRGHLASLIMPETFDQLMTQVQSILKPHGYLRIGHQFYKPYEHNWGVIAFTELEAQSDQVKIQIEMGTYSKAIAEFRFQQLGLPSPDRPDYADCHWKQSVLERLNDPRQMDWWALLNRVQDSTLTEPHLNFLTSILTQTRFEIDQHLSDAQLTSYWLDGGGPEISKLMCLKFASILLKASEKTEALEEVLHQLATHYRHDTILPHLSQIRGVILPR